MAGNFRVILHVQLIAMEVSVRSFMTRFRLLAAAVFLISASILPAERVEDLPKPTDYVSDYAHVLSPAAIARIDNICSQLDHSKANAQVAVVTVGSLDGDDAADYASRLEDKWKMGKKGSDRGVLILLAIQDHKRRIDVGYGLEGILPDGKVGDIGREMVPYLRDNDFDDAVTGAVTQVAQVIAADANVTLQDNGQNQPPRLAGRRPAHRGSPLGGIIFILIILLFFGGFRFLAFLLGWNFLTGGYRGGGWGGGGFGGGGFGGGGGGGGGGSGFGGFGGGGFGGGGAGGDW
jgi:uncharacterized protein